MPQINIYNSSSSLLKINSLKRNTWFPPKSGCHTEIPVSLNGNTIHLLFEADLWESFLTSLSLSHVHLDFYPLQFLNSFFHRKLCPFSPKCPYLQPGILPYVLFCSCHFALLIYTKTEWTLSNTHTTILIECFVFYHLIKYKGQNNS